MSFAATHPPPSIVSPTAAMSNTLIGVLTDVVQTSCPHPVGAASPPPPPTTVMETTMEQTLPGLESPLGSARFIVAYHPVHGWRMEAHLRTVGDPVIESRFYDLVLDEVPQIVEDVLAEFTWY